MPKRKKELDYSRQRLTDVLDRVPGNTRHVPVPQEPEELKPIPRAYNIDEYHEEPKPRAYNINRASEVAAFVCAYYDKYHEGPTCAEIADALGMTHRGNAAHAVVKARALGLLGRDRNGRAVPPEVGE